MDEHEQCDDLCVLADAYHVEREYPPVTPVVKESNGSPDPD